MEHPVRMPAPAQSNAQNVIEGPITKKQSTEYSDAPEASAALVEQKSQLCRELVSKAAFLLRQATILRSDKHISLAPSTEHQISDIFARHIGNELLRMHKQLDVVAAEHAKVHVMLEQIRRCNATPYPAWDPSQQVSSGLNNVGPLVEHEDTYVMPQYTDKNQMPRSPYMEHYERWLIPASHKAPKIIVEQQIVTTTGRATRNSNPSNSDANANSTHAMEANLSPEADLDPLIRKNTKGEWVKLECWGTREDGTCCNGRSDFSNIQGFVNHYRMDHGVGYRTHAEAADACGTPVDLSEEMQQAYEEAKKSRSKRSRIVPGDTAVKYDGDESKRNAIQQTQNVDVVKLASVGTKSADELAENRGYVPESTVHPFNKPDAMLPAGAGSICDNEEDAAKEVVSVGTKASNKTAFKGNRPTSVALKELDNDSELPYLSQLLAATGSNTTDGPTFDFQEIVRETRTAIAASRKELNSCEPAHTGVVGARVTKAKEKPRAKASANSQPRPGRRGRPPKEKRSNVSEKDLPGIQPGVRPFALDVPATIRYPVTLADPALRSSVWPPVSLSSDQSSSRDIQSPMLPSLISNHGSMVDKDDEPHYFGAGASERRPRPITVTEGDDGIGDYDKAMDLDE